MEKGELDRLLERAKRMDEEQADPEGSGQLGQIAGLDAEDKSREVRGQIERRFEDMGIFLTSEAVERTIRSDPEFIVINRPRLMVERASRVGCRSLACRCALSA